MSNEQGFVGLGRQNVRILREERGGSDEANQKGSDLRNSDNEAVARIALGATSLAWRRAASRA